MLAPELDQRLGREDLVERARAEAAEIERDVGEAELLAERDDPVAHPGGDDPRQVVGVELEPGDRVVEPDADLAEPEVAQAILERVDAAQPLGRDLRAVREPRRQARELRLVPRAQAELAATARGPRPWSSSASTSGIRAPRPRAAAMPGRTSPRSSRFVPRAIGAPPSRAATGPATSISSVLHSAQRCEGLSAKPGHLELVRVDDVVAVAEAELRRRARRASATSERAIVGDTAVTAWQRAPSASAATLSRNAESTPPENATTTWP